MRVFLSSYRLGNHGDRLAELIGKDKPNVGVVMNAGDLHTAAELDERYELDQQMFEPYQFNLQRLDLRKFFGDKIGLGQQLEQLDALWVRGGNTFVLRRAMQASGFDELAPPLIKHNKLVYAGYSAGAIVVTQTLSGIELVDDPIAIPDGYDPKPIWEGLGLVDYSIAPHFDSDHPESPAVQMTVNFFEAHGMPYMALRDGQAILIDHNKHELLK